MNKLKDHNHIPSNLKSLYHSNKISLWDDDEEEEEYLKIIEICGKE